MVSDRKRWDRHEKLTGHFVQKFARIIGYESDSVKFGYHMDVTIIVVSG